MTPSPPVSAAQTRRIVSYNVRYFGHALMGLASTRKTKRLIARGFAGLEPLPQLIALQEVETRSLRSLVAHRGRHRGRAQLGDFMHELEWSFNHAGRECPYDAYYFQAHTYRLTRSVNIYTTGLAILVDRTLYQIDRNNAESPERITHNHVRLIKDRKQTRICAHLRLLDTAARPLHIFNTHLSLPTPFAKTFWRRGEKLGFGVNQLEEAKSLAVFVQCTAGDEPFVVCGDLNAPPGSPVYRYLTEAAGFAAAQGAMGQGDASRPHGFPTAGFMTMRMHLDHLFSGGGLQWTDVEGTFPYGHRGNPFHGLSDHVPLIAGFRLGKPR